MNTDNNNSSKQIKIIVLGTTMRHLFEKRTGALHTYHAFKEEQTRLEKRPFFSTCMFMERNSLVIMGLGAVAFPVSLALGGAAMAAGICGYFNPIAFRYPRVTEAAARWKKVSIFAEQVQRDADVTVKSPSFSWKDVADINKKEEEVRALYNDIPKGAACTDNDCYAAACNELRPWERQEIDRVNAIYGSDIVEIPIGHYTPSK